MIGFVEDIQNIYIMFHGHVFMATLYPLVIESLPLAEVFGCPENLRNDWFCGSYTEHLHNVSRPPIGHVFMITLYVHW